MVSLRFQGSLNRVAEFSDRTRINRPIQSESEDLCRNSTGRSRPLCSSLPSHLRLCSRYRSRTAAFSVGLPLWAEVLVVGPSVAWSPSSRSFFSQVLLSFRSNKRTRDSRWLLVHDINLHLICITELADSDGDKSRIRLFHASTEHVRSAAHRPRRQRHPLLRRRHPSPDDPPDQGRRELTTLTSSSRLSCVYNYASSSSSDPGTRACALHLRR